MTPAERRSMWRMALAITYLSLKLKRYQSYTDQIDGIIDAIMTLLEKSVADGVYRYDLVLSQLVALDAQLKQSAQPLFAEDVNGIIAFTGLSDDVMIVN